MPSPEASPRAAAPWLRLVLTLLLPLVALTAQRIVLPGIDLEQLDHVLAAGGGAQSPATLSIVAIGLTPAASGFLLVELCAWLIPALRLLRRGDLEGRRKLRRAALVVTLGLALIQSYFIARWLQSVGPVGGMGSSLLTGIGASPAFLVLASLTMTAGTFGLLLLGALIERHALGAGLSVLMLVLTLHELLPGLLPGGALYAKLLERPLTDRLFVEAVLAAALAFTALTLIRKRRAAQGLVFLPTSGLAPLVIAASLLVLPSQLAAAMGWQLPEWLLTLSPGSGTYVAIQGALLLVLGLLFSRWFTFSGPADPARNDPTSRRRATLVSLALLLALAAATAAITTVTGLLVSVVMLVELPAVILDLTAEWTLRSEHGELVPVWMCAHLPGASQALERLRAAGIPAVIRGLHHRGLWHIYRPLFEMTVLVPAAQSEAARAALRAEEAPAPVEKSAAQPEVELVGARFFRPLAMVTIGLAVAAVLLGTLPRVAPYLERPALRWVFRPSPTSSLPEGSPELAQTPEQRAAADAVVIKERLGRLKLPGARVRSDGELIVVELPALPEEDRVRIRLLLTRPARLAVVPIVRQSEAMTRLIDYVNEHQEEMPQIRVQVSQWINRAGETEGEFYLQSSESDDLSQLVRRPPIALDLPSTQRLVLEEVRSYPQPEAAASISFRTRLVETNSVIGNRDITAAEAIANQDGGYDIQLTLSAEAAVRFEEFTGSHIGSAVAIVIDDEVMSAPRIESRIPGGRVRITLGRSESPAAALQESHELAALLQHAALSTRLLFEREELLNGKAPTAPSTSLPSGERGATPPTADSECARRCTEMDVRKELREGVSVSDCMRLLCAGK